MYLLVLLIVNYLLMNIDQVYDLYLNQDDEDLSIIIIMIFYIEYREIMVASLLLINGILICYGLGILEMGILYCLRLILLVLTYILLLRYK